tara:strand:- start:196 stop:420 length:225 start_codon:yes stop_codon:yes gene_type:complete
MEYTTDEEVAIMVNISLKKLYKKLQTNLMNARMDRSKYKEEWDRIENDPEDMRNESETETFERILDWEEFDAVR